MKTPKLTIKHSSFLRAPEEVPLGASRNPGSQKQPFALSLSKGVSPPVSFSCLNFAGGSPAAGNFLLLAQKKVTKEKGTLVRRSFGLPCVARAAGRLRNSRTLSISGYWLGCERLVALELLRARTVLADCLPATLRYSAAHKG
ncbi:MAG: hypothetical protein K2Y31_08340 [Burkholderiales bacterium]|nr:hypothetical protein [Burkholderiales bacterium]